MPLSQTPIISPITESHLPLAYACSTIEIDDVRVNTSTQSPSLDLLAAEADGSLIVMDESKM